MFDNIHNWHMYYRKYDRLLRPLDALVPFLPSNHMHTAPTEDRHRRTGAAFDESAAASP